MSNERRHLISSDQELLLKAAFMDSQTSQNTWAEWQGQHNLDDIDLGSYALFPQLYLNLRAHGLDMSKHPRVQGIYRRCTYTNRLLFHRVLPALDALKRNGLRSAVSGQTASVCTELGCYPLDRFHVAMDRHAAVPALKLFDTLGWKTKNRHALDETVRAPLRGALTLESEQGDLIQIQWRSVSNAEFWSNTERVHWDGRFLSVSGSTNRLLDAGAPGLHWHRVPFFLRVAHAMLVFRYAQTEVNWDRLATNAREQQVVLPLLDVLAYAWELDAPVPDTVIDRLRNAPVSKIERYEYQCKVDRQTFKRRLVILWLDYRRAAKHDAGGSRHLGFVDYLRMRWRIRSPWQLPWRVLRAIIRSFRSG